MRKILFIAATHGNEGFAVDVMRGIEQRYDKSSYSYDWIIGNPRALEQGVRFTEKDLNRSAPGNANSPYYEERRAAEIVRLAARYDTVIDLHGSVASCGVVKIIPYPTAENIALAKSVPLKRNVVWYNPASTTSGPLVQHTSRPSIEIECGPKADPLVSDKLRKIVAAILDANKADEERPVLPGQEFYSVYGVQEGEPDGRLEDFKPVVMAGESFLPFMSKNQYPGIVCYKMRRVTEAEVTLPT